MIFRLLAGAACLLWAIPATAAATGADIVPRKLTCEYRTAPSVVDAEHPRLSWINEAVSGRRGASQKAWQIRVASSEERLLSGEADLWDSRKVKDDRSILIPYGGRPLRSCESCWWQVRVWDDRGRVSEWSEPAVWHMGLLDESDWQCQWIGAPWQGDEPLADTGGEVPPRAPLLRKAFRADKPVASARFYGTGLGYFELYMNGEKVGDDVLVPNQTNYGKRTNLDRGAVPLEDNFREYRVMYLGYDVTDRIRLGENAIGAMLGNGFYNAKIHWVRPYGTPRFFGQLHIVYEDGTQQVIPTDPTWRVSEGPLTDMVYSGEHYDARAEQPGWCSPGFDDSSWKQAAPRRAPGGNWSRRPPLPTA